MLLCPQCQFDNPDHNKFCQQCGISLCYKACPKCGTQVTLTTQNCDQCGTLTGQVWWAMVTSIAPPPPAIAMPEPPADVGFVMEAEPETQKPASDLIASQSTSPDILREATPIPLEPPRPTESEEATPVNLPAAASFHGIGENATADTPVWLDDSLSASPAVPPSQAIKIGTPAPATAPYPPENYQISTPSIPAIGEYLDSQQRYQIIECLSPLPSTVATVRVLDLQPLQPSPLKARLANPSTPKQSQSDSQSDMDSSVAALMNLEAAHPYLTIQSKFPTVLSQIHDAWQYQGQGVVLLEDCSQFPLLVEQWHDLNQTEAQRLHWLYQMAELWPELERLKCRQSLLKHENVRVYSSLTQRVTEMKSLRLQCLYPDPMDSSLSLQNLGQVWQPLWSSSQQHQGGAVADSKTSPTGILLQELEQGKISTVSALKAAIQAAMAVENPPPSTKTCFQPDPLAATTTSATSTTDTPVQLAALQSVGLTDIGRQRDHNEDSFGIWTQQDTIETPTGRTLKAKGLYLLCDGMGGHASGEVASQLAVDTLKQYFQDHWQDELPTPESIQEAIGLTNQVIYQENQGESRSGSGRMGTTLVMALVHDTQVAVAHVGDSRLYCLTDRGGLEQITLDHEVGMREIKRGIDPDTAYSRPDAYQLTQALGPRDNQFVRPDVQFLELDADTLLILASDGLTDNQLLETHCATHLKPLLNPNTRLEVGVQNLIDLANQYNGHDNITAILIRVQVQSKP